MTEEGFDFWRDHSLKYLEMAQREDNLEYLASPDGYGKSSSDCGDTIAVFLNVEDDRIEHISFKIQGCLNTLAAANTLAHLLSGKKVDKAWELDSREIVDYLETMPEASEHCADLAVEALRMALQDVRRNQKNPWKKLYRAGQNLPSR